MVVVTGDELGDVVMGAAVGAKELEHDTVRLNFPNDAMCPEIRIVEVWFDSNTLPGPTRERTTDFPD